MPEIPLAASRAIAHGGETHRMQHPGILRYVPGKAAESLGQLAGLTNKAGQKTFALMQEYNRQKNEMDNRLAAAEDRALLQSSSDELRNWIAANPGASDEEKEERIAQWQSQYEADRLQIVGRMTADFRKLHDAEISAMQSRIASDRQYTLIQSAVQHQSNQRSSQLEAAVAAGNFPEARRLIEEASGTLWSAEQCRTMLEVTLPQKEESFAARNSCEADPRTALAALEERSEEGVYRNFPRIPLNYREQLIRYCQSKIDENEREIQYSTWLDMRDKGTVPSIAEIRSKVDTGQWSPRLGAAIQQDVEAWNRQQEAARARAREQLDAQFYISVMRGKPHYSREEITEMVANGKLTVPQSENYLRLLDRAEIRTAARSYNETLITLLNSGGFADEVDARAWLNDFEAMHRSGEISDEEFLKYRELYDGFLRDLRSKGSEESRLAALQDAKFLEQAQAQLNIEGGFADAQAAQTYLDSINQMRRDKKISDRAYNGLHALYTQYHQQLLSNSERAAVAAARANEALARQQQQQLREQFEVFKYELLNFDFSSRIQVAEEEAGMIIEAARRQFAGHPEILSDLQQRIIRAKEDSFSTAAVFNTPAGKLIKGFIDGEVAMTIESHKDSWLDNLSGGPEGGKWGSQAAFEEAYTGGRSRLAARVNELYELAETRLKEGMPPAQIKEELQGAIDDIRRDKVVTILIGKPDVQWRTPNNGATREFFGQTIIYDNGKWKLPEEKQEKK